MIAAIVAPPASPAITPLSMPASASAPQATPTMAYFANPNADTFAFL